MEQEALNLLIVQQKKKYLQLNEIMDTTVQLAEALSRDDEISVRMLIAMRETPVQEVMDTEARIRRLLSQALLDDGEHLRRLMRGNGMEPPKPGEEALDEVSQKNYRLLSRIVALDKPLNLKIGKDQSFYQ